MLTDTDLEDPNAKTAYTTPPAAPKAPTLPVTPPASGSLSIPSATDTTGAQPIAPPTISAPSAPNTPSTPPTGWNVPLPTSQSVTPPSVPSSPPTFPSTPPPTYPDSPVPAAPTIQSPLSNAPPTYPNSPTTTAPTIPSPLSVSPPTYPNSPAQNAPQVGGGVTSGPGAQIAASTAAPAGQNLSSFYDSSVGGVYGAGAAGNVFLPDGSMADPNNLPAGFGLTPEAKSRLKAGYAVQLQPGGGASYLDTAAINPSTQNFSGGVGTSSGTVQFNSNDPQSVQNAQAAGYVPPSAPTAAAVSGAQANAAPWQNAPASTAGIAPPPPTPSTIFNDPTVQSGAPNGTFYTGPDGQTYDQYGNLVTGAQSAWPTTSGQRPDTTNTPQLPPDTSAPVGPVSTPTTLTSVGSGSGPSAPSSGTTLSGGPTDTGGSTTPASTLPGVATTGAPPPTYASSSGATPSVGLTPTDSSNPLTSQTITGPTADRFKIAQDQFDASSKASAPAYEASLRDALRSAAAGGAIGSGMLNTSEGDLAARRDLQLTTARSGFLSDALKGAISDAQFNTGVAQQQQGFQKGQQDTAFNEQVAQTQLSSAMQNQNFQQQLQTLLAGEQGDPATIDLALANIFGSQASAAGSALAQLIKGTAAGDTSSSAGLLQAIQQEIAKLKAGGGSASGGASGAAATSGAATSSGAGTTGASAGGWTDNGDGTWTGPDGTTYDADGNPVL